MIVQNFPALQLPNPAQVQVQIPVPVPVNHIIKLILKQKAHGTAQKAIVKNISRITGKAFSLVQAPEVLPNIIILFINHPANQKVVPEVLIKVVLQRKTHLLHINHPIGHPHPVLAAVHPLLRRNHLPAHPQRRVEKNDDRIINKTPGF